MIDARRNRGACPAARVCIVYPADPFGIIPGGIDSIIRGMLKWAPREISFELIGITTDPEARPVGVWTPQRIGTRTFSFLPIIQEPQAGRRKWLPLSLRFTASLLMRKLELQAQILEFHRIEPMLAFYRSSLVKTAFFHQDMEVITREASDIGWRFFPFLYFFLEKLLVRRLELSFAVKQSAVDGIIKRIPETTGRIFFVPTWMEPDIFFPMNDSKRGSLKKRLSTKFGIDPQVNWFISVGRLDQQKDPLLLIRSFAEWARRNSSAALLVVGDGVLRPRMLSLVKECGIEDRVVFVGAVHANDVADLLRASDLFVLTSEYEGMPMVVIEALGCGVPVVSTDVGEVRRVVKDGVNGIIVKGRTIAAMVEAFSHAVGRMRVLRGSPCVDAAKEYVPKRVLGPVYEKYLAMVANQ